MSETDAARTRARKSRRGWKIALAAVAIVAVAVAALVGYGLSERGLPFVIARIVAQSGGRITVDEPTGSIAGTMRFRRITWRGDDVTVTAEYVVVDWNPGALWSRRLSIRGLGAQRVDIEMKPSSGATEPPTDLQLPLAVAIERLAVGRLDWHAGPRKGYASGLEFGYDGDAKLHRIRDLRFVSDFGSLTGNLQVATRAPLEVSGNAGVIGDGPFAGARVDATFGGPVARIGIAAKGTLREAALALQASATPFAAAPFESATVELESFDAATFDAALPRTRARLVLTASPHGDGLAGRLELVNDDAGPVDTGRFPIARMSARYAWEKDALLLEAIDASMSDGGSARGDGRIALAAGRRAARFALTIADLDLARVHTKLVATRLAGRVVADANAERQTIEGDVRDRDRALAFAAIVADERVDVTRFRASTAAGSLAGTARILLNDAIEFTMHATMERLDPSRFVAVPEGSLDGRIDATGALRPRWRVSADIGITPPSRLAGLAVSGTAKGALAADGVRNASADLAIGTARVHVAGSAGAPGDRLAVSVDAPHVAELAPLLPSALPRPVSGALHASANATIASGTFGGDVEWRAQALQAGPYKVATLQGRASIAAAANARASVADRALAIDAAATGLSLGPRTFDSAHASASGSLAHHRASLALRGADVDLAASVDGSLRGFDDPAHASWNGLLTAFENRVGAPMRLRDSATLAARRDYLRIADAHVEGAGGHADIGEFVWDDGRISTHGTFTGIAATTIARLAGRELPLETSLVLGGEWSIAATPRLTGRFSVQRERGDLFADVPSAESTQREALGVSALTVAGTLANDALDARLAFASDRAGSASATVAVGAVGGAAPGTIPGNAPLRLAAHAELASLAVFQPWFGTEAAVNGRARLDVEAHGTVGDPLWSGTLQADALRLDAPQYGVSISDGRVRAHLAPSGIVVDEATLVAGDGTFTASGLIALPGESRGAQTRVNWKADRFRITNRPDLRLVVDGSGTLALADRRLALRGNIDVVEGRVEYDPSPSGRLASDIVIEGQPVASRRESARDVPLALDVDVDLGRALSFAGEGLETGLAGRVKITTSADGKLQGRGTIRAVNGTYFAFGQKLTIDRGRVIFDGPIDNPALDVVALRKNLPVEAGVELTGTVKVPRVRITSNPPVSENEALAWLVTGQGLNSGGRIDYAALSAASAALLGKRSKPFTAEIAQRFGLDDISLQSSGTQSADGTAGQVVVFGKRLSDRLSLGYEQGLSLASSALRLEYALSRQVTLRAEAGIVSGVSIVYRRTFR